MLQNAFKSVQRSCLKKYIKRITGKNEKNMCKRQEKVLHMINFSEDFVKQFQKKTSLESKKATLTTQ